MTLRQKSLKIFYPFTIFLNRIFNRNNEILFNDENIKPLISFYSLKALSNSNDEIHFSRFKGKKVMIVNTASDCGYTAQYDELQKLFESYEPGLSVIGFPSNDFFKQEKGNNEEILQFCKINYGVTFPLMKKSVVIKNENQNNIFKWLTDKNLNGWNNHQPGWNFSKYLVNEEGILMYYFGPAVSPLRKEVQSAIEHNLINIF
jgi:glutathione peroxidase